MISLLTQEDANFASCHAWLQKSLHVQQGHRTDAHLRRDEHQIRHSGVSQLCSSGQGVNCGLCLFSELYFVHDSSELQEKQTAMMSAVKPV